MKEHRSKALRVTTTNNITREDGDMFGSLQLLRLELELRPGGQTPLHCVTRSQTHGCCQCQAPRCESAPLDGCMSCENMPLLVSDLLLADHEEIHKPQKCVQCSTSFLSISPWLQRLISFDPSHCLLTGDLQSNWPMVLEAVRLLKDIQTYKERNLLISVTDHEGNTPLLIAGRRLLKEGAFSRAAQLTQALLEVGCDPNAINKEGRTLLSYSVQHMDDSVDLTRTLLNAGATVWPIARFTTSWPLDDRQDSTFECSAFTWFLRAIIRRRRLDAHCLHTLHLLSEVMGEQPRRMHSHVLRTMFKHARCYKVLGPVFYQLKTAMMGHWTQPKELRYMCRTVIRTAVGSHRLTTGGLQELRLPDSVQQYLLLG